MPRYLGIDLAWGLGSLNPRTGRPVPANETGLCALHPDGRILDADWARGVDHVAEWILTQQAAAHAVGERVIVAIDAPLIVPNLTGMRECEREVGRRYGRWKVSANASNQGSAARAGQVLLARLEERGIRYSDGVSAPLATEPATDLAMECYPYTTIVGVAELGYDEQRPRYKRLIPGMPRPDARLARAAACDDLILRVQGLTASPTLPALDLASHPATAALVEHPSPLVDREYKHREDLLDAVICAVTAALWHQFGGDRVQALGATAGEHDARGRRATIVAPFRPEQRAPR